MDEVTDITGTAPLTIFICGISVPIIFMKNLLVYTACKDTMPSKVNSSKQTEHQFTKRC
jgi:hypothetical protein